MIEKYGGNPYDIPMGTYFLQPYTDMHLNTELPAQNGLTSASNPMYSYIAIRNCIVCIADRMHQFY